MPIDRLLPERALRAWRPVRKFQRLLQMSLSTGNGRGSVQQWLSTAGRVSAGRGLPAHRQVYQREQCPQMFRYVYIFTIFKISTRRNIHRDIY